MSSKGELYLSPAVRTSSERLHSIPRIDEKYLDNSTPQKAYRLETYRSSGNPSKGLAHRTSMMIYFALLVERPR